MSAGTEVTMGGTSLVDLLDRLVDRGAVVTGDVVISLAGIDLVRLDLRLLLTGIGGSDQPGGPAGSSHGDIL
jgi:hypothetical protein